MNKSAKWVSGLVVVVLVAAGVWYFGQNQNTGDQTGPIKIGASLPLTGEAGSLGQQVKNGIDLAAKQINDAGGINGRPIEVVFEDDKCSKDGASTFTKLTTIDHVTAILGPVCSAAAGPGVPIAQQAKVPTIIWGSAPGLTLAGDYIFRTYPSDAMQGSYAADWVYTTLGKKKVAILNTNNEWGKGLMGAFKQKFTELGGTIVATESVDQAASDMRTQLIKIKSANPELIYIPLYPSNAAAMVKQAKALGIKAPILGGDALEAKEFLSVPEAEGALISEARFGEPSPQFVADIKAVTGADAGFYTTLGYDALYILSEVMQKVGTDKKAIRDALVSVDYKTGVSLPEIAFNKDREQKYGDFWIKVVKNQETIPYTQ